MISVRVPGKVMLAGEYAVLRGGPALAATLDKHLLVRARTGPSSSPDSPRFLVTSDLWADSKDRPDPLPIGYGIDRRGSYIYPLFKGKNRNGREWGRAVPLSFKGDADLTVLEQQVPPSHIPLLMAAWEGVRTFGIEDGALHVISELDIRFGLGSSSALYLGVFGACAALTGAWSHRLGAHKPNWEIPRLAMGLQHRIQKRASGYDLATQYLGGMVEFQLNMDPRSDRSDPLSWPGTVLRLPETTSRSLARYAHVFVGGRGAPTGPLVRSTVAWIEDRNVWDELSSLDERVQASLKKLLATDPSNATPQTLMGDFCESVKNHRQILSQMPQYPREVAKALEDLPECDKTWTFKTTGAGGEDALLLWGEIPYLVEATKVLRRLGWKRLEAGFERCGMLVQITQKAVLKNSPQELAHSLRGEFL